tara:strand:+ start:17430 stop:17672 length:243 start_codon:yes stop_codon:yes gene_type:complete
MTFAQDLMDKIDCRGNFSEDAKNKSCWIAQIKLIRHHQKNNPKMTKADRDRGDKTVARLEDMLFEPVKKMKAGRKNMRVR